MEYDVQFFEAFPEEAEVLRARLPASTRAAFLPETVQESGLDRPGAPLLSTRTQSRIPASWGPGLKGVLTRSTGYDHVVGQHALAGVAYGYLPLYCARAVAEQAMLLWTALLRKLPLQQNHFLSFSRKGLTGREAAGQRLLVVGVGHIGYEVVKLGRALGMNVQGVDPVQRHHEVNYVALHEALPDADILVVAMNLTPANQGFFRESRLAQCKPGLLLVNIARGELTPTADLVRLLQSGQLGGVALDVYEEEPGLAVALRTGREPESRAARSALALSRMPQVICTPHNAFNTHEALARKAEQAAAQVDHFLKAGAFLWDVPRVPEAEV